MNMDEENVAKRIQYLRDTLGKKTAKHNHFGFVDRDFVSVQGFQRNLQEVRPRPLPIEIETRERRAKDYGFESITNEIGLEGAALVLSKLRERKRALPKLLQKERVVPTEQSTTSSRNGVSHLRGSAICLSKHIVIEEVIHRCNRDVSLEAATISGLQWSNILERLKLEACPIVRRMLDPTHQRRTTGYLYAFNDS